jgi:hypothetical protein
MYFIGTPIYTIFQVQFCVFFKVLPSGKLVTTMQYVGVCFKTMCFLLCHCVFVTFPAEHESLMQHQTV